ncbi:type I-F CRISPR-associated endonuclease Cas1 [Formicincola oecophyllae]|uniref:Type I-F CRISPR-associated endonuclease Cas1 n=1 Tax=Formicincola oecophyllae TaxID=2558361 RepID=A0A4Y6U775_9PROT|nr:type I-F CRISPR-associated endonuclease Cas1f [Formicincola oecophyllae]QDH13229.1 type I-F CRISPR-associated endonuclease Cas1 [Formicincola oecophyllae]
MLPLNSSDLKSILPSRRANMWYLEYCKVLVNGGRVEYVEAKGSKSLYWNIPIANTAVLLLGCGTSITQAAMRMLAQAGVVVGFTGGQGTPLFAGTSGPAGELAPLKSSEPEDPDVDPWLTWLEPQHEYRPTEYMQHWMALWLDPTKRLEAGKVFQKVRLKRVWEAWNRLAAAEKEHFQPEWERLAHLLSQATEDYSRAGTVNDVLTAEGRATRALYGVAAKAVGRGAFQRAKRGTGQDDANRFLDTGNYLAYGLGATVAWTLGLPFALAVIHGKTRRGALVFDIADLVKDAHVLPQAFLCSALGLNRKAFRERCIKGFVGSKALGFMFDIVKDVALGRPVAYLGITPAEAMPWLDL